MLGIIVIGLKGVVFVFIIIYCFWVFFSVIFNFFIKSRVSFFFVFFCVYCYFGIGFNVCFVIIFLLVCLDIIL